MGEGQKAAAGTLGLPIGLRKMASQCQFEATLRVPPSHCRHVAWAPRSKVSGAGEGGVACRALQQPGLP